MLATKTRPQARAPATSFDVRKDVYPVYGSDVKAEVCLIEVLISTIL